MLDTALLSSIATQLMSRELIAIDGASIPVRRTSSQRLRTAAFTMNGRRYQAIEQNAGKPSRWGNWRGPGIRWSSSRTSKRAALSPLRSTDISGNTGEGDRAYHRRDDLTDPALKPKQEISSEVPDVPRRRHWTWLPLGIAVAGVGTIAAVLLRGCWHSHLSWPMRYDDAYSYRVCTDCGMKRLFDPVAFRSYGPYGHDLQELIARHRERRGRQEKRPA